MLTTLSAAASTASSAGERGVDRRRGDRHLGGRLLVAGQALGEADAGDDGQKCEIRVSDAQNREAGPRQMVAQLGAVIAADLAAEDGMVAA